MYSNDLIEGEAAVIRAKLKIDGMRDDFPQASDFIHYFEEIWSGKIAMWITNS